MPTLFQALSGGTKSSPALTAGVAVSLVGFTSTFNIGDIIVVSLQYNMADPTSITDDHGNTYTRVATPTVISGSLKMAIYYTIVTNNSASTNFINLIPSANTSAGAAAYYTGVYNFSPDAGTSFTSTGILTGASASSGTAPSITTGSLSTNSVLVGNVFINGPNGDAWTEDADTLNGSWSSGKTAIGPSISNGTTGGSAASNYSIRCQYKFTNASGAQTFNPTLGTSRTYGVSYISIIQTGTPVTFTPNNPMGMMGFFGL